MTQTPCAECNEQVKKGRHADPHQHLRLLSSRPFRGSMFGGWEEMTYQCAVCGAVVEHTNDKNEVAPFWWFKKTT